MTMENIKDFFEYDNINSVDIPEEHYLDDEYTLENDCSNPNIKKIGKDTNNPNILVKSSTVFSRLKEGKLYNNYLLARNLTSKDYISRLSGIDFRTLNKYDNGYYEYLDKEDSEKLLKAINIIFLPEKMHRTIEEYPNIIFVDYAEQESERHEQKRLYSEKISEQLQKIREDA